MTRTQAFGDAAEGLKPTTAAVESLMITGKDMGNNNETAFEAFKKGAFKAIEDGVANLIDMAVNAMKGLVTKIFPGGGLASKGDETAPYNYNGYGLHGMDGPS